MNGAKYMTGLSSGEVERSRGEHGANIITKKKKRSFAAKFLSNLGDPVIRVLIGALALNLIFSLGKTDPLETVGIALSIFLATFISTLSESGSEAAFERLREEGEKTSCRVVRAGDVCEINASEVVVGDIVLLSAGERICADGTLVSGEITVDQSAFTGESREIKKRPNGKTTGERKMSDESSLFCGSVVLSGEGLFLVGSVGDSTYYGKISGELASEARESPLKLRLRSLAKTISILGYVAAALVAAVYLAGSLSGGGAALRDPRYVMGELLHALTLGVTIVVVAVPEGLPMMIAVVLSSNIKRMIADNVLVKKPVGIEAAGSMNILFTDKTGTLTEGRFTVAGVTSGSGALYKSYASLSRFPALASAFLTSAHYNGESKKSSDGRVLGGNAADRALLSFVASTPFNARAQVVSRVPFDSARKYSAVTLASPRRTSYIKGAPEVILPCVTHFISEDGRVLPFSSALRSAAEAKLSEITAGAGRVIAVATREGDAGLSGLTLIALVHLRDRIRPAAKRAVRELRGAGVQVVMITGDAKNTALAVARECAITTKENDLCLSSGELAAMSDDEIKRALPRLAVVYRALPTDKSRLVKLSGESSLVVGMTGDGVNDAPALKAADVGFAMGDGVQVARDAGDVVILDNDLASIAKAVLYGRTVLHNIKKFIVLQLTMNLFAVGISMIGPFIGVESPVTVVQMLWVNIIMDTLGALAFAGEGALPEYMKEPPKKRDAKILDARMAAKILWVGGATVALCVAFLKHPAITERFRASDGDVVLLTAFFAFFIFASVCCCFDSRTERLNVFSNLSKNRPFIFIMILILAVQILFVYLGGSVLRTVPLTSRELLFSAELSLLVLPIDAVRKIIVRITGKK